MSTVLIVGSGGREYALARRFSQDSMVDRVLVVPGNPAVTLLQKCECREGHVVDVALCEQVSLVVVGPEAPLVEGGADDLRSQNIPVVGPSKAAAVLERSKIESKQFMVENEIRTARAVWFDDVVSAFKGLDEWRFGTDVVVKSDALAGGKGVVVCDSIEQAKESVHAFMVDPEIRIQTDRILLEERLEGVELSAFALCDGTSWRWLGVACDHKRVGDGDVGPNTGGMGCFTAQDWLTPSQLQEIEGIFDRVVHGMKLRGTPYQGVLFAGLMVNLHEAPGKQVSVLEFNIRLGDPETQVLMPTLQGPIYQVFLAAAQGRLSACSAELNSQGNAVHVVAAAYNYPSIDDRQVSKGAVIELGSLSSDVELVFAGVDRENRENGRWVTNGGRVLGVTAVGTSVEQARILAYSGMQQVRFDGMHYRTDIASPERLRS